MTLGDETFRRKDSSDASQCCRLEEDQGGIDQAARVRRLRNDLCNERDLKSRLDDKFLLKFLRARKFDNEATVALVKSYYKQRIKYPDFYRSMRYSSFPYELAVKGLGKLPDKDPEGRTVFFATNLLEWDPTMLPVLDILAITLLSLELVVEDEEAQRNGFVFLMDATGFGTKHLRAFDPYIIAQIISVTWNSFPAKFKQVHVINAPYYFKLLFSMIKPFLSKKLRKRFQFHATDFESLHKFLPSEILPEEFGGKLGPIDHEEWNRRLLQNDHVIERDRKYGYFMD